jgi:hypothetical protein
MPAAGRVDTATRLAGQGTEAFHPVPEREVAGVKSEPSPVLTAQL